MLLTKKDILEGLNEDQKEAVINYTGPCFIVAGPGSGKTRTIISRAAYMISEGIKPENILMFTFTNKAAGEIRERIENLIGDDARGITVGTYHSVCSRLLRKYAEYLGYRSNFSIYDDEDKLKVLKEIVDTDNIKCELVGKYISRWKERLVSPSSAILNAEKSVEVIAAEYYQAYQKELKKRNVFDFDDLIYMTIKLMRDFPEVKEKINRRFQYVISDEYHDSSRADVELIKLLAGDHNNICLILDDEQSIYSFRGSDLDAVLSVTDYFPDMKTFVLRRNYRSTKRIVQAARSVIANNSGQIKKEIFTENELGEQVAYLEFDSAQKEANNIVKLIMRLKRKGFEYKDIAILYRMSYLSRVVEEAFLENGIPYAIIGGLPFYARKEIKDVMAYVRLAVNPYDIEAFERVVNTPKRGIGKKSIAKIREVANDENSGRINIIEACERAELSGKAKQSLSDFVSLIQSIRKSIEENVSPKQILEQIVHETAYCSYLLKEKDGEDRLANVEELISIASQYDTLEDFFYNMSLFSDISEVNEDNQNRVQMLTMHAAKGLEFKVVFIIGANEGIIPHWRAETTKEIEEERRLFYVAMTRAEKLLFITRPRTMHTNGRTVYAKESRFVKEIDPDCLRKLT